MIPSLDATEYIGSLVLLYKGSDDGHVAATLVSDSVPDTIFLCIRGSTVEDTTVAMQLVVIQDEVGGGVLVLLLSADGLLGEDKIDLT